MQAPEQLLRFVWSSCRRQTSGEWKGPTYLSMFNQRRHIFYLPRRTELPPRGYRWRRRRTLADDLRWLVIWIPLALLLAVFAADVGGVRSGCAGTPVHLLDSE